MRTYSYKVKNEANETKTLKTWARSKAEAVESLKTREHLIDGQIWTAVISSLKWADEWR